MQIGTNSRYKRCFSVINHMKPAFQENNIYKKFTKGNLTPLIYDLKLTNNFHRGCVRSQFFVHSFYKAQM